MSLVGDPLNSHLWGYLIPLSSNRKLLRIDFWRITPEVSLGRNPQTNTLTLPGSYVSANHAKLCWNGQKGELSRVELQDLSTNGTWVGDEHVKGRTCPLVSGVTIGFGAPLFVNNQLCPHDYRYRFVETASLQRDPATVDELYVPQRFLGKGTYGWVTRGISRQTGESVAVKLIKYRQSNSDIFTEIAALERVDHPHVVKMLSFHHGHPGSCSLFIAMEYLEGSDLFEYMDHEQEHRVLWPDGPSDRGIPQEICRDIMYQLCNALAHIHTLGIVHRDLKPENIMLKGTNIRKPFIVLADFGLAHVERDMSKQTCLTDVTGSWVYMAPEIDDYKHAGYDEYVDSFSAGIVFLSMVTLVSPWLGERSEHPPLPPLNWAPVTSTLLNSQGRRVLELLLRLDPEQRISPAGALTLPWLDGYQPVYEIDDKYKQLYLDMPADEQDFGSDEEEEA